MIRSFTLPPAQVHRALAAGGPLSELQLDPAQVAAHMSIAVVEVDGEIVAYWVAWKALHLEPLWVRDDHRKSPAVIGGIIEAIQQVALASGEPAAYAQIDDPEIAGYAGRLGFTPAPGTLYYLTLQQPARAPVGG